MRKIKLIKSDSYGCFDCYDNICTSCSDWQEVSEETFALLKSWEGQRTLNANGVTLVVFEDVSDKIDDYVKDITEFVQKEKARLEKLEQEEKKRKAKAKAKRDAAKAKKEAEAIEKAKKLLMEKGQL